MNRFIKTFFLSFAVCLSLSSFAYSQHQLSVTYQEASDWPEELLDTDAVTSAVELINTRLLLRYPLEIVFGGEDGPLYDPQTKQIFIPYSFLEEVETRFEQAGYSIEETGITPAQATTDALIHTIFHEIGHALVEMFAFPILGKEEDAVDSLATVLLIEFFEGGDEMAISAADLFDLESTDYDEFSEQDFWDEHSLDAQRFYNTLCMVYGSDPVTHAGLVEQVEFTEERAELCVFEYEQISESWLSLLEKHKRQD